MELTREEAEILSEKLRKPELSWTREQAGRITSYTALSGAYSVIISHEPLEGTTVLETGFEERLLLPSHIDLVRLSLEQIPLVLSIIKPDETALVRYEERGEFGFPRNGVTFTPDPSRQLPPAAKLYEYVSTLEKKRIEETSRESQETHRKKLEGIVRGL